MRFSRRTETRENPEMTAEGVYKATFPQGSKVRVADRSFLESFMSEWKYHHKLQPDQLPFANQETIVKGVAFYHGGDPVYTLENIPGLWLEPCLRASEESAVTAEPKK